MARKKDPLAAALAFLEQHGVDTSEIPKERDKYDYRHNDAAVVFASSPSHFLPGICKNCGKTFAVNKRFVGFCSEPCRREDWRKTTGLEWGAISTKDVWDGDPPMIITPQQMKNLEAIVDWFNKNRTSLSLVPPTEESEQEPEIEIRYHTVQIPIDQSEVLLEDEQNDLRTSLLDALSGEVPEQMLEEEDLFGFS